MTPPFGPNLTARRRRLDSRGRDRGAGQAFVELALILPVLLALLLGALDLGRVFYAAITVENAAKEAALRASEGNSDWAAAAVNESRGGFVTIAAGNVTAVFSDTTNQCGDNAAFGATVSATVRRSSRRSPPTSPR
jgi:Flp pilus assembly protein TadG